VRLFTIGPSSFSKLWIIPLLQNIFSSSALFFTNTNSGCIS
jgi:hypothetical protein